MRMLDLASVQLAAPVSALAFSPLGDLAIGVGRHVWLVPASGARPARITAARADDDDRVACLGFHGARRLAIATTESGLMVLELGGTPRATRIRCEARWYTLAWSPDGAYVVGGQYEPWVSVIDVARGRELRVLDPDVFDDEGRTAVAFSADGETLFSTAYNQLCRWRWRDVIANKPRCRQPKTGVDGHAHLRDLAMLADGSWVAVVDREDTSCLQPFTPAGTRAGPARELDDHIYQAARAGDHLAAIGYRKDIGVIAELLAVDGTFVRALVGSDAFDAKDIAASPDGAIVVVGGEHGAGAWATATGELVARSPI